MNERFYYIEYPRLPLNTETKIFKVKKGYNRSENKIIIKKELEEYYEVN